MVEEKKETTNTVSVSEKSGKKSDYHRLKGKGERRSPKGLPNKGGNDFAFWNEYPELMSIATRFPWMHIAGTTLQGNGVSTNLPNVLIQHFLPVPGVCKTATAPLNLAFRQLYLDMHRKYRGIGTYQASDIGIALMCIESVLQLIVECERVYGILREYPIKSRIEPEGLLLAMGYSAGFISTAKAYLADFRYGINRLIELAKRLPLPQGMSFFKNHTIMNGFIYKDSKDERSSLFVFVMDGYYRWATAGDSLLINNASTAVLTPFDRSSFTSSTQLLIMIENLLTALLQDSDILRITSDFIACYGESNMQVLSPLPEDYRCEPVYSETMLHKLHNSEHYCIGDGSYSLGYIAEPSTTTRNTQNNFCIYQVQDVIYSLPVIIDEAQTSWSNIAGGQTFACTSTNHFYDAVDCNKGYVNDSWLSEPTQEVICESMLWKTDMSFRFDQNDNTSVCFIINSCGTEILTILEVYSIANSSVVGTSIYESSIDNRNTSILSDGLCHIDWAPLVYNLDSVTGTITSVVGDVDNVTVVSKDVISKILDAANLSAFKVTIANSGSKVE